MISLARSSPARRVLLAGVAAAALVAAGCGSLPGVGAAALVAAGGGWSSAGGAAANTPTPNAPEKSPAGDIPDNQAYVPYSPPRAGYSVKVPEGWSRSSASGATTFTDK